MCHVYEDIALRVDVKKKKKGVVASQILHILKCKLVGSSALINLQMIEFIKIKIILK